MSVLKRVLCLCLVLATVSAFFLIPAQAASFAGVKGPTLVKQDGTWYYVKNGAVCYDTSLVKYNGEWYYVKNGTTQPSMTTLVKYNNEWWYVVKGKVASQTTSLVKYNNEWWYVVKGKIAGNTTGLIKYNNEWWYVVKGKVASNTTTLVKYNNEWFYVVKGKMAGNTTTLVKYNGGWYYIVKGKMAAKTTTLIKYNNSWYYVKNGVHTKMTGFFSYGGRNYYVKNGIAQTSLNGAVTVNGSTYFLNGGVVTVCATQGHAYAGNICTRCKINPVTYSASVVSTWLKSNGSYVDGDYLYGFDLPTQSGGVMYVGYDTTQNMVYLNSEICHEDGSSNIVIVIVGTGEFGVSSDPDDLSKYAEIYGTLDLPKYTKSGKLSFTEYAGDRSQEANLKEEARYAVSDTVEYYGYFLKEAVGMSLYDAGFRSFQ